MSRVFDCHIAPGRAGDRDRIPELVGLVEIATRLRVKPSTPPMWRQRGLMPEQDLTLSGTPVWMWSTIADWARRTDRIPTGGVVPAVPLPRLLRANPVLQMIRETNCELVDTVVG